ncbi:hypothetical protein Rmf_43500 [Roseomonas fluvialis]|uniref:HTH araC/xylS-type domain-containing protein n=1 Tax=Roseomonas fluvialis TaxID=1750527 RepID=A0ABM7Y8V0_9PROT|nr:hypothetical protein Rmf_43500 [Roseomonas fluvialis]
MRVGQERQLSTIRTLRGPTSRPFLHRGSFARFDFTYGGFPSFGRDAEPLVSEPSVLDFSFSGHSHAVVSRDGRGATVRRFPPGSGGSTGLEPIHWIDVPEPSEFVEVRVSAALRADMAADLRRPDLADLGERFAVEDPPLYAMAARVRAAALGGRPLSDLEGEALVGAALRNAIIRLGGRPRHGTRQGLDRRRLQRVAEYIDAHLAGPLTLAELADVAAVSRYHFARMFTRAVGLTPHAYVQSRRMDRARTALAAGASAREAAHTAGYVQGHSFRRALQRAFGP